VVIFEPYVVHVVTHPVATIERRRLEENLRQDGLALGNVDAVRTARGDKGVAYVHLGFDGLGLLRTPRDEAVVVCVSEVGWVLRGALDPAVADEDALEVPLGVGRSSLVAV
jgi:hypothetical protein